MRTSVFVGMNNSLRPFSSLYYTPYMAWKCLFYLILLGSLFINSLINELIRLARVVPEMCMF